MFLVFQVYSTLTANICYSSVHDNQFNLSTLHIFFLSNQEKKEAEAKDGEAKEGEDGEKEDKEDKDDKEDKSETDSDKKGEDTEEEEEEDEVDAEILATIEKFVQYGVQPEWMQIHRIINSKVSIDHKTQCIRGVEVLWFSG